MPTIQDDLKGELQIYLAQHRRGRHLAITAEALTERFRTSIREINEAVRQLRKAGALIGSTKTKPAGYYIPDTEEETREYLNTFKSELFDMLKTYNIQKRAARQRQESIHQPEFFPAPRGQLVFI